MLYSFVFLWYIIWTMYHVYVINFYINKFILVQTCRIYSSGYAIVTVIPRSYTYVVHFFSFTFLFSKVAGNLTIVLDNRLEYIGEDLSISIGKGSGMHLVTWKCVIHDNSMMHTEITWKLLLTILDRHGTETWWHNIFEKIILMSHVHELIDKNGTI